MLHFKFAPTAMDLRERLAQAKRDLDEHPPPARAAQFVDKLAAAIKKRLAANPQSQQNARARAEKEGSRYRGIGGLKQRRQAVSG